MYTVKMKTLDTSPTAPPVSTSATTSSTNRRPPITYTNEEIEELAQKIITLNFKQKLINEHQRRNLQPERSSIRNTEEEHTDKNVSFVDNFGGTLVRIRMYDRMEDYAHTMYELATFERQYHCLNFGDFETSTNLATIWCESQYFEDVEDGYSSSSVEQNPSTSTDVVERSTCTDYVISPRDIVPRYSSSSVWYNQYRNNPLEQLEPQCGGRSVVETISLVEIPLREFIPRYHSSSVWFQQYGIPKPSTDPAAEMRMTSTLRLPSTRRTEKLFEIPDLMFNSSCNYFCNNYFVKLESITCDTFYSFRGTCLVRNLSFEKKVSLRVSGDRWRSYQDFTAEYMRAKCPHTDRFQFRIDLRRFCRLSSPDMEPTTLQIPTIVEICVQFVSISNDGNCQEFWDNKDGENYKLHKVHV